MSNDLEILARALRDADAVLIEDLPNQKYGPSEDIEADRIELRLYTPDRGPLYVEKQIHLPRGKYRALVLLYRVEPKKP